MSEVFQGDADKKKNKTLLCEIDAQKDISEMEICCCKAVKIWLNRKH